MIARYIDNVRRLDSYCTCMIEILLINSYRKLYSYSITSGNHPKSSPTQENL